ncbi:MAG TPA: division/cell wall cluster transcriptional repressor MraZ [Candidatus Deferrimicrobium sp.]|nr:division/cell wall cluster transcriptional repressor MraZ [Candidatus Deferrimicrobium sp.]
MAGFLGRYYTTLDDKGRCSLPAKLRTFVGAGKKPLLDGSLVLTKGLEGCLILFPKSEWDTIQSRLSAFPFTQRDFRHFSRWFYSSAGIVAPDKNGRILIPSHLIEEAGLKKDLLVIGLDRWVEIWNPERFDYFLKQFSGSYEDVAERLLTGNGTGGDQGASPAGDGSRSS